MNEAVNTCDHTHMQAVQEVFGSDVESDLDDEDEPAAEQPSRKRAAERDPKRPPAKRKPRSRSAFSEGLTDPGRLLDCSACHASQLARFGTVSK